VSGQIDLRQRITTEIITALSAGGLPPWQQPWSADPNASGPPANAVSGRGYTGVNVLMLQLHRRRHGLRSRFYATFRQWEALGCRVRPRPDGVPPGRWGCTVVYCRPVKAVRDTGDGERREDEYLLLRHYTVFGADQADGPAADRLRADASPARTAFVDFAPAERAVAALGADIRYGGDRAFYRRQTQAGGGDFIQMPPKGRFASESDYYSTLWHELAHWSEPRVGWAGSYAEGELRAEMAAAFTLAELGVPQREGLADHAAYLRHWLTAMRADPRFIFRVSADASRAVDYLLAPSRPTAPDPGLAGLVADPA
jgi:antirestriction protein ArdC